MQQRDLEEILEKYNVLIRNSHVVYTSGKHGREYFNKDALYPHPDVIRQLCVEIALKFGEDRPEVVLGPAIGGVLLSSWAADALQKMYAGTQRVLGLFAEKIKDINGERFELKRGYDRLIYGKRTLVVEDVVNTGGSVREIVELARTNGADVIGVGALCNRGGVTPDMIGSPPRLVSLWNLELEAWNLPCHLCDADVPINTSVGHGREFLAKKLQELLR